MIGKLRNSGAKMKTWLWEKRVRIWKLR